jgi:glutaredoxin 2
LDNSLSAGKFSSQQEKEAVGRIGFYLRKCSHDLRRFDKIADLYNGVENVLTDKGQEIYTLIRKKYSEVSEKWQDKIENFDYSDQAYNFTFKIFDSLNE